MGVLYNVPLQGTNAVIGDLVSGPVTRSLPTIISGNYGNGIYTMAPRTTLNHIWVGFNKNGTGLLYRNFVK